MTGSTRLEETLRQRAEAAQRNEAPSIAVSPSQVLILLDRVAEMRVCADGSPRQ